VEEPVEVRTTALNTVANQPLPDVTITVNQPQNLRVGDEIWVYVQGAGIQGEIELVPVGVSANVIGPGRTLQLSHMRNLPANPGLGIPGGVSFTVDALPSENVPLEIVLSGLRVTGSVLHGVEYNVVVSGVAVAQNDQSVRASLQQGGVGGTMGLLNVGTFTSQPYSVHVLSNVSDNLIDAPPSEEEEEEAPAGPTLQELLDEALKQIADQIANIPAPPAPPAPPVVEAPWVPVSTVIRRNQVFPGVAGEPVAMIDVLGQYVGFISVQAFAHMIEANLSSQGARHTITGRNSKGQEVVAEVTNFSPTVRVSVNGVVDATRNTVASWAPATGVDASSLTPELIGTNVFLPFRAIAAMFDYTVELINFESISIMFVPMP
jgi:hypothetical protein